MSGGDTHTKKQLKANWRARARHLALRVTGSSAAFVCLVWPSKRCKYVDHIPRARTARDQPNGFRLCVTHNCINKSYMRASFGAAYFRSPGE